MVKNKRSKDGRFSKCKRCDKLETAVWRSNNPEKHKLSDAKYRSNNRNKISEKAKQWRNTNLIQSRAASMTWYSNNKLHVRNKKLQRAYGITELDFLTLLLKQNHVCAICKSKDTKCHSGKFHVDHCHTSGKVRGLLCGTCNTALGKFHDSPAILQNAIVYLNKHASPVA